MFLLALYPGPVKLPTLSAGRGALATVAIRAFSICAQLAFFILIARTSTLEAVGLFAVASAYWVLCRALLPMGWNVSLLRRASVLRAQNHPEQASRLLTIALGDTAIFGVAWGLAVCLVAAFAVPEMLGHCVLASVIGLLWAEIGILVSYLRANGDLLWSQLCDGVVVYILPLMICGGVACLQGTVGLDIIVGSFVASAALAAGCLFVVVRWRAPRKRKSLGGSVNAALERRLARRLWWNQAFSALSGRASILLAAPVAGVATTAIVEAGLRAQLVGVTLAWAGGTVASPRYAVAHETGRPEGPRVLNIVTWAAILPSMLVVAVLTVWGETILSVLGAPFASERWTITLMALAAVIELPASSGGYFLMMTGRERVASLSTVVQLVALVACAFALAPSMGAVGIALAVVVAATCRSTAVLVGLRRQKIVSPVSVRGLNSLVTIAAGQLGLRR